MDFVGQDVRERRDVAVKARTASPGKVGMLSVALTEAMTGPIDNTLARYTVVPSGSKEVFHSATKWIRGAWSIPNDHRGLETVHVPLYWSADTTRRMPARTGWCSDHVLRPDRKWYWPSWCCRVRGQKDGDADDHRKQDGNENHSLHHDKLEKAFYTPFNPKSHSATSQPGFSKFSSQVYIYLKVKQKYNKTNFLVNSSQSGITDLL